jgi:hypothetical protein
MTHVALPACAIRGCMRLYGPIGPAVDPTWVCRAYPLGIPDDIVMGADLHLTSRGDDDGFTYQPNSRQKHLLGQHSQGPALPRHSYSQKVWQGRG